MAPPILAIILDGLGDRPHPDFDDRTPLELARTPVMDELATQGATGLIDPLGPGIVPGSGTGHLGLFDYDPLSPGSQSPSRGAIEALGLGLEPADGRVAARGNFVTLDAQGRIEDRRSGRFETKQDRQDAAAFIEDMDAVTPDGVSLHYHPRMGYRFVVVVEDGASSVSDTDPGTTGDEIQQARATSEDPSAVATADRVNATVEACTKVLAEHPLNDERAQRGAPRATGMVTRGLGPLERGATLEERWGVRSQAIAGGNAYRGIASFMGMSLADVPGATGDLESDYGAKLDAALNAVESGVDLVFLHIKAPDICGENGDFEAKRGVLEQIDAALSPLQETQELVIGLTGDHSTPCSRASHSGDPVPLLFHGPGVRVDSVESFGERACAAGGIGRVRGGAYLRTLMDLSNRTKKVE